MSWFFLGIISAVVFSVINIIDKVFLVHYVRSARAAIGILGLFSLLFFAVSFIFNPLPFDPKPALLLVASGIFEVIYIYFYLLAIKGDEIGYLIPLFGVSPIIVFIISIVFFHTSFNVSSIVGTLFILVGIAALVVARYGIRRMTLNRFFWLMLVASLFYALQSIALDYSASNYSWFGELMISRLGVFIGALAIMLPQRSEFKVFSDLPNYVFFLSEALYILATYFFIAAITKGHAFYVLSVLNVQPLIVLLLSYFFFRLRPHFLQEDFKWNSKWLAVLSVCFVVGGTILLQI